MLLALLYLAVRDLWTFVWFGSFNVISPLITQNIKQTINFMAKHLNFNCFDIKWSFI